MNSKNHFRVLVLLAWLLNQVLFHRRVRMKRLFIQNVVTEIFTSYPFFSPDSILRKSAQLASCIYGTISTGWHGYKRSVRIDGKTIT